MESTPSTLKFHQCSDIIITIVLIIIRQFYVSSEVFPFISDKKIKYHLLKLVNGMKMSIYTYSMYEILDD